MNKELEKAADGYAIDEWPLAGTDSVYTTTGDRYNDCKNAFKSGAKWQEENSEKRFRKKDIEASFDAGMRKSVDFFSQPGFTKWFKENYEK